MGNAAAPALDWYHLFTYVGYALMSLLSVLGAKLWKDVERLKGQWLTRDEFNEKVERMETERDKRHAENTGRFERLETRHFEGQVLIERRLGEVAAKIEGLRPPPPGGQAERRRY